MKRGEEIKRERARRRGIFYLKKLLLLNNKKIQKEYIHFIMSYMDLKKTLEPIFFRIQSVFF